MNIKYDENKLSLNYTYKITPHTHSTNKMKENEGLTSTQYLIPIHNSLKQMLNIRKVLFIYHHTPTNTICLTTQEPPQEINYKLIRIYSNKIQIRIQLPTDMLNLNKDQDQTATITYYPQEKDHYSNQPLVTLQIQDNTPKEPESEATIIQIDNKPYLRWQLTTQIIPEDLKPFLNQEQTEHITKRLNKENNNQQVQALVNLHELTTMFHDQ